MLIRARMALVLTLIALPQVVAGSLDEDEFRRIVTAFHHAIGEHRLDEAMSFYHEDSPHTDRVREKLKVNLSSYLHRTGTFSFCVIHRDAERGMALVRHLHRRIAGIKFLERHVEVRYVFRRQGPSWKIWSSVDRARRVAESGGGR